jgi:hypothetical protein
MEILSFNDDGIALAVRAWVYNITSTYGKRGLRGARSFDNLLGTCVKRANDN